VGDISPSLALDPGFPAGMTGVELLGVVVINHSRHPARDWRKPVARDGNKSRLLTLSARL